MPKFLVTIALTYHKDMTIYAPDEDAAMEKAEEIAEQWNNVEKVEALEAVKDDD